MNTALVTTKVVKIPVRVMDDDNELRILKYKALDKMMGEARYLGNMAIRYAIAYRLKGIPKEIDIKKDKQVSVDTRIYRTLKDERKYLDAGTFATLARNAAGLLKKSDKDAWAGRKSLPTYRALFVPFRHNGTSIAEITDNKNIQFVIEPPFGKNWLSDELIKDLKSSYSVNDNQRKLKLVSCFSWKDTGAVEIAKRIVAGEYLFSDSQIKRKDKDLFVFLTYKLKVVPAELNPEKVCGVDLGYSIPAMCAVNSGPQRLSLGDGKDVWAARSKFRAQRKRNQRKQGLYTRTKAWERSEKEDRWIHTYYHALTRQVIKFCQQQNCGIIHMEDLEKLRQSDMDSEYKRLIWVPSKFYNLLEYKAKEIGIEILKINPRNTSRRCSECGYIAKENRKTQSGFLCVKCGHKANADYNAAKNIALATKEVIENGYIEDVQNLREEP